MITLYNTLSRKKEPLRPIHPDWVGLYTCGPTVYNAAHIGNLRTYIFEDILERTLRADGYAVRRVMNITDVGHMTGDTDAGEDKLDLAAQAQKKSVEDIAQFYTDAFFDDLAKLNILKPDIVAPASKFVREQIAIIQMLFEKGFAYDTPTAVYFDVSKFPTYGVLSGQSLEEKMTGAREEVVVDDEKRNPVDFALWFKLVGKFKKHLLHWTGPWGEGFPGWHIECSAISRHFLGQPFDIHTGGVDLIGTHHTNEIAQSEAAYDVPLAHVWMHGEHLLIDGGKMAKSEGNFLTLADLQEKGYHPLVYRYLVLGAHYRTRLNFTWESLDAAKIGIERLYEAVNDLYESAKAVDTDRESAIAPKNTLEYYRTQFRTAMDDDLNTPRALAILHEMLADGGDLKEKIALVKQCDTVLGLGLERAMTDATVSEHDTKIAEMARIYGELRGNKQFIQSDALRKEIEGLGYSIRDSKDGSRIRKRFF
ncbi:MAG TPA: cysteine--tRNA ligase [Candidatus Paceibacterota bacterium]|nr:cysteine--tRNA ligase [Candidatus Paceibacterota bacterium]